MTTRRVSTVGGTSQQKKTWALAQNIRSNVAIIIGVKGEIMLSLFTSPGVRKKKVESSAHFRREYQQLHQIFGVLDIRRMLLATATLLPGDEALAKAACDPEAADSEWVQHFSDNYVEWTKAIDTQAFFPQSLVFVRLTKGKS
jgi:hypothetical protein